MKDDWHNPEFALHWNKTALEGNPIRGEQMDLLIFLLMQKLRSRATILDLGIGSGQIEEKLLAKRPDLTVIGVDSSQAMLDLAKQRLNVARCHLIQHDISNIESLAVPLMVQAVISVQTLHHLPHHKQREVYRFIHQQLEPGGLFLLMDRIKLPDEPLHSVCSDMWDWLEQKTDHPSGKKGEQFLERLQHKDDHPASLEEHLIWLKESGFTTGCLHLSLNRALLVGMKV
ncbi:class I SAM-dependent methyltransferase [Thermoflavimicrobium dichotomicum]|uniref:Methyltransferase domain-containing protein n=1 Tax=Thermoflavimicrobium dichotomicum TaxID=46223 RepID=A0A1I3UW98_9BACL|nr:class I SAM-dependent methyltransferase [Thermoflavimicrobium dichotomicum]SFJ87345.1 Methyltransferase domain-containing protein [Thermoflavimicrobium dichotomicum]